MAAKKDYYRVLGVPETASADEVKKAYRKLAKKNHPDVTGGDKTKEARFKEITEAHEVIGDEKKRAEYDAERKGPFAGGSRSAPGGSPFSGGGFGGGRGVQVDLNDLFSGAQRTRTGAGQEGGFGDLFAELFNRGGTSRSADLGRGADVSSRIEIDLPVAAHGGDQPVIVDGKRWTVKIPAGIEDGQTIRLVGKGESGRGGAGDLLLEVHIKPHPVLRRHGADLEVDVPITIDEAVLGAKVDVTTLEGKVQMTIPPSTSSGLKLRLRGKGMPKRDGARGDLYAVTQITLPKEISPQARELLLEFAKLTKK